MQVINASGAQHARLMGEFNTFLTNKGILPTTVTKILRWQAADIERTNGLDENGILERMPLYMRQEVFGNWVNSGKGYSKGYSK